MSGPQFVQAIFFVLVVRPFLALVLGLTVRRRENLPTKGPAILVANHNSHLDTVTVMSLFPLAKLHLIRPAAAADYFRKSTLFGQFTRIVFNIIPISRSGDAKTDNPLHLCEEALDRGEIVLLFPEGSRGEPEKLEPFKKGVAHLVKARPETPVYPLFMHGLGKAMPKGTFLFVPFNCDVVVGSPLTWSGDVDGFTTEIETSVTALADEIDMAGWEG